VKLMATIISKEFAMKHQKLIAGVAVAAALGAGATAGLFLGVPGLSSAQTPTPSSSASPSPGMPPGSQHRGAFGGTGIKGASFAIVAKDLTMAPADLKTALRSGQSIAALAKARNVDVQKIINDLVADATTRIDAAASSARITSDQAAKMKANLSTRIPAFVNGTHEPKLPGVSGTAVPKLGAKASLGIVARDLTMTPADLKTALKGGQSIAALAKARNVDVQKIINDLVADATTRIDAAASSARITSDQAAKMKANLTAGITAFVNGTGGKFGPGFGHGFRGPLRGGGDGGDRPTSTASPANA
jgi:ribosomal protein S20